MQVQCRAVHVRRPWGCLSGYCVQSGCVLTAVSSPVTLRAELNCDPSKPVLDGVLTLQVRMQHVWIWCCVVGLVRPLQFL
jgi:hypothetical protein